MSLRQIPLTALPAWALLNDLSFHNVKVQDVTNADKGSGLVTSTSLIGDKPLITVPSDLVLSRETVQAYAKVDSNFGQLLDAFKAQTDREFILLFLLIHMASSCFDDRKPIPRPVSSPWTEYIKFLPPYIPVPTLWTQAERDELRGTSLELALAAKMLSFAGELDRLREVSSAFPFWNNLLWESELPINKYWKLADAWFRSRSMELPRLGSAMVPGVDMANHSAWPNARYEVDSNGAVGLLLRDSAKLAADEEVTISYGSAKRPAEMLFSYGFIDKDSDALEMTLPLSALPDDPLGKAKLVIFGSAPKVELKMVEGKVSWESPFAYLACLNEEDGIDFRVLQDVSGERTLRLFWQDEDVTEKTAEFQALTETLPIGPVLELRVVTVLNELVQSQLDVASASTEGPKDDAKPPRKQCIEAAALLKRKECQLLGEAALTLEDQGSNLLKDSRVQAYLGLDTDNQMEASAESPPDAEDFS